MFVTHLLIWCLIIYGITQIIVEASIFSWLRNALLKRKNPVDSFFGKLISCFLCASVWISFILSATLYSPTEELWPHLASLDILSISVGGVVTTFLDGMLGSSIVWFLYCIESKLTR